MKQFARIDGGVVVERLDADELPEFHPSLIWMECDPSVKAGWLQDGDALVAPPPPLPPAPAELTTLASAKRDELLTLAALRIAPLQDAVDLGQATDADTANLTLWKQYRVAVNRVTDQAGFPATIDWPLLPA